MSVLVVGSVAFDTVKTPFGERDKALGGSANFFSMCASAFTDIKLCAVVGDDFPEDHIALLNKRGVDTAGLIRTTGKTFHWTGEYKFDLNEAHTLATDLNVFADFKPDLPESYRNVDTLFLANIDPELQSDVLDQVKDPKVVALDTMNFWIEGKTEALKKVLGRVDIAFMNDAEVRQLSGEHNIVKAARGIQALGPRTVVVKRGEYGALFFHDEHTFFAPAFPLEDVFDPTGAGDTFAGGFLGWLDKNGADLNDSVAREAMLMGAVMASFVVEDFSFDRMRTLSRKEIRERWMNMRSLSLIENSIDLD